MTDDDRVDRHVAGGLIRRVVPTASIDELDLPPDTVAALRRAAQTAKAGSVPPIVFAGPPGTGKTMAAEALGNELSRYVYRVDLSRVVSKYIGETEKNLREMFEAVEKAGSLVLFDEADALFGRRTEVNDSHDQYANIDVTNLLELLEQHRGVVVLMINSSAEIDPAFLDRSPQVIRFSDGEGEARRNERPRAR